MADLGRERYWSKYHAAAKGKRGASTVTGRRLLREATKDTEKAVRAWFAKSKKGKGKNAHAYALAAPLKPGVVAMLAVRVILDSVGSDNSYTSCAYTIGSSVDEEVKLTKLAKAAPKAWRDFRRRHKRFTKRSFNKMLADVCAKASVSHDPAPKRDRIQLGVALIEMVIQNTGIVKAQAMSTIRGNSRLVLVPADETLNWLSKSNEAHESLFPFFLPMVDVPNDWVDPWDGGYHTNLLVRRPLVKTRDRDLVGDLERATMPEVYRAVNCLQRTPWRINKTILACVESVWDAGEPIADLPSREDMDRIKKPQGELSPEAFKEWKRRAAIRYQEVVANRSRRVMFSKILFMAQRFAKEARFYYPHQVDFRGRFYPIPFFLNPQGSSLARGLLEFAEGKPIKNDAALSWFEIHGANCFGVDKVPFSQRRDWVRNNIAAIKAVYTDPLDCRWWTEADSPWEFLAWCLEYGEYLENPATFQSHLPVAMDGSNNGLQIFSLLMRDPVGAEATNVTPGQSPRDIYQDVADLATSRLLADPDKMAARWLEFCDGRVPRKAVKRSVMTKPYGSTFHSCVHYTRDWQREREREAKLDRFFPTGYDPAVMFARHAWAAIETVVGKASECMDWLRAVARIHAEHGIPVRWTAPTGFPVKQSYLRYEHKRIKTAVGDVIRYTQYREDTSEVALLKQMNGVSPNLVHSYDAAVLAKTICLADDRGIRSLAMIHDSYGTHAADCPELAELLRDRYVDVFQEDLLERFRRECQSNLPSGVVLPPVPERGELDVNQVRRSLYFFA